MKKIILVGAEWCPITKKTKELWEELKKEYDFEYEYVDVDSDRGKEIVKEFSITNVPKTIMKDRIIFHGFPDKEEAIELIK